MNIVISRTDNLGDVILTLPLATYLKQNLPDSVIYFLGKAYTKPIIDCCVGVDYFIDKTALLQNPNLLKELGIEAIIHVFPDKEIAKIAFASRVPIRIGTGHRLYHLWLCNRLVFFSRNKSDLHESQLNFKLLKGLGIQTEPSLDQIKNVFGFTKLPKVTLPLDLDSRPIVVLHPKSKGSAREWPLRYYQTLAKQLVQKNVQIVITGTAEEEAKITSEISDFFSNDVINACGKLSLQQLIRLLQQAHTFVACSTGPLHIAAILGKHAIGLYPPMRPVHPGRWAPIGANVEVFVLDKNCSDCRKHANCSCIAALDVTMVVNAIARQLP